MGKTGWHREKLEGKNKNFDLRLPRSKNSGKKRQNKDWSESRDGKSDDPKKGNLDLRLLHVEKEGGKGKTDTGKNPKNKELKSTWI